MDILGYCVSALWTGLELLGSLLFCGAFSAGKKKQKHFALIAVTAGIIMVIYSNLRIDPFLKQLVTITILTVLAILRYNAKGQVLLLMEILYYSLTLVIDAIIMNGTGVLLGLSYSEFAWRILTYTTAGTVSKLLTVFISWMLYHYSSEDGLKRVNSKWLILSMLFPAVSVSMLVTLLYDSTGMKDISILSVAFSGVLAVANVAILYIISSLEKATKQEQDMRLLKQQISLQSENYTTLQKNYTTQRKATHEFERHLQTLGDLLDQNEYAAASDYLHQLQNNRTLQIFSVKSNHPVFDVILNQKHQLALEHEIKMQIQVNDLSEVSIQTDALVVLLSNVLDNAIEACRRLPGKKEIYCSVLYDDGLYISVRNTSLPVDIVDNEIVTSKADRTEHGYGIPAVKYVLEQLGAEYTFDYQDGWFQFAAEVQI